MKILDLHIIEFGCLSDYTLIPDEGINLLVGDNETGKSTILLFIKFMLYGLPKRGNPERERSVSRMGHRAAGSMTIQRQGEIYRIERSYTESGRGSDKHTVIRMSDGAVVLAGQEPGEALLSVPREVFESSCGIGQLRCADIGGKKEVAAIRNLLTSADESVDIERIEKRLESIRVIYRHKRGEGGKIGELDMQIAEEEQRLRKAIEVRLRIETLESELRENAKQIEEKEEQLRQAEMLLTEVQKIEVLRRFDAMRKNAEEARQVGEAAERLRKESLRTEYMPVSADAARLVMLSDSLRRMQAEQIQAEDMLRRLQEERAYDERAASIGAQLERSGGVASALDPLRRAMRLTKVGAVFSACGAISLLAGLGICLTPIVMAGLLVTLVGLFVTTFGLTLVLRGRKNAKRIAGAFSQSVSDLPDYLHACAAALGSKRSAESTVAAAQMKVDGIAERIADQQEDLRNALQKTTPESEATPDMGIAEAERIEAFLAGYTALKNREKTLQELVESDRRILSVHDETALRESLTVSVEDISMEMVERAAQTKNFYTAQLQALRMQETNRRTELINCRASVSDPLYLSDRIASLKQQRKESGFYCGALIEATEAIRRAAQTMRGNITPAISRGASKWMQRISGGKYADLRMNGEMELSLFEENGLSSPSQMLSGGTRDVAYIALRIALMQQIFGEELPPLLMDETLCQTDDGRSVQILSLLSELCRGGLQVLLFTCHDREQRLCQEGKISATSHRLEQT